MQTTEAVLKRVIMQDIMKDYRCTNNQARCETLLKAAPQLAQRVGDHVLEEVQQFLLTHIGYACQS